MPESSNWLFSLCFLTELHDSYCSLTINVVIKSRREKLGRACGTYGGNKQFGVCGRKTCKKEATWKTQTRMIG
jgi:hypothetical protein